MKKIITRLCCTQKLSTFLLFLLLTGHYAVMAQPNIVDAQRQSSPTSGLPLGPSANTSTYNVDGVDILNTDMLENTADNSTSTPFLTAIVWGNATGLDPNIIRNGLYVEYDQNPANSAYASLPNSAKNPDVVLGYYDNGGNIVWKAAVVYEDGDNIYLEVYTINNVGSGTITLTANGNNPIPITDQSAMSNPNGEAHWPHIDLFAENDYTTYQTSAEPYMFDFIVVWQENISSTWEIQSVTGDLINVAATYQTATHYKIADGIYPDVAAVATQPAQPGFSPSGDDSAYVTYLSDDQTELYLASGIAGTSTYNVNQLESGADEILPPRVEGTLLFDAVAGGQGEPSVVVVASVDSPSVANFAVNAYAYRLNNGPPTLAITPIHMSTDPSGNGNGFDSDDNLMPVVCGTNDIVPLGGGSLPGSSVFTVAYYSTYTNDAQMTSTTAGDYWGNGIDGTAGITPSGNFCEVNYEDLQTGFSTSTLPAIAVTNSSNTGHDLVTVWFGGNGDEVRYKYNGTTIYNFKPGKPASVMNTAKNEYTVFPNPVRNTLYINNAAGADYKVMDITGRVLSTGKVPTTNAMLEAQTLVPGIYILQLSRDGYTEKLKFVKQ
ncbi:MAG: T9SS type A sorting domain-containing protein [Taibaiella sp.]|nr:T9SS type A sorting domain-containing protein [Taibaiella sp.]